MLPRDAGEQGLRPQAVFNVFPHFAFQLVGVGGACRHVDADHDIGCAFTDRHIVLVDGSGRCDLRHLSERYATELHRCAHVEPCNRRVEIGFELQRRCEQGPPAENEQQQEQNDQ